MSAIKTSSNNPQGSAKSSAPAGAGTGGGKKSFNDGMKDYFQSLQYEWRKITWPERKQWKDSTIVVFVFVLVLMAALASMDFGIGWVMNRLLGLNR